MIELYLDDFLPNKPHVQEGSPVVVALTSEQERLVVCSIRDAANHIAEVARREHLKADRIERVGLFVTSLRSHLSSSGLSGIHTPVVKDLCRKDLWYDAGVIDPMLVRTWGFSIDLRVIRNLVAQARHGLREPDVVSRSIEEDLNALEREVAEMRATADQMESINKEGEEVADQLCKLIGD